MRNTDLRTVAGFGDEWRRFDQTALAEAEAQELFTRYFRIFPWDDLPSDAVGFDMGCGSGRWARFVAPRVGRLLSLDASHEALVVAKKALTEHGNAIVIQATVGAPPLRDSCMDFGYSLGVLHHVPDTLSAIRACARLLRPGAPFLVYLYYAFDNRPVWYRAVWRLSDVARRLIALLPAGLRAVICDALAACIYCPTARLALLVESLGFNARQFPLFAYRRSSFYTMRTDARDRFGTALEQRFTRDDIRRMMENAGLVDIEFSESEPYWCAVGRRAPT